MAEEYSKEEFWKLYKKLPARLKEALADEETDNNIERICKRNKIEMHLGKIVDYVGQALVGLLPPQNLKETIEKELIIEESLAKKITYEINRFIFYPIKSELEDLYSLQTEPGSKERKREEEKGREIEEEKVLDREKEIKTKGKQKEKEEEKEDKEDKKMDWTSDDSYREPIA